MQFLFRLLRNNLFPVTFIILLGISLAQVLRFNLYQESFYFNSSKNILNSTARLQNSVGSYFKLSDENKALVAQNQQLLNKGFLNTLPNDTNVFVVKDSNGAKRYEYQVAHVIKSNTRLRNNFITIDKGSNNGIKKGMSVISPIGIVGLVFDVTENFSLVLPVLNSKFVTTPMIPEIGFREGSVTWNGLDPDLAQLNYVNKFENLKPGMKIYTSNYSIKFPPGVPIGTIKTVKKKATSSFYDINIKLAVDFKKIGYVYVVKDNFRAQLDTLQLQEDRLNVP